MNKGRIEAFSDGVFAIIITIMVLELKTPHGSNLSDLFPLLPTFFSYLLSFTYVAIYWNNHHHLFQAVRHINGRTLWLNSFLLFWLSLIPFATAWAGESHFDTGPVALYGFILLMSATAYLFLVRNLVAVEGGGSPLATAVGKDRKGKISMVFYVAAILCAFVQSWVACGFYVLVAAMWFIPDSRIEKHVPTKA